MKKRSIAVIAYSAVLTVFTGYVMLDTFVLPSVYDSEQPSMNMSVFDDLPEQDDSKEIEISDNSADSAEPDSEKEERKKFPRPDGDFSGMDFPMGDPPRRRLLWRRA